MKAELCRVIESRSFHSVFQPIYSLDDGQLQAVEALTRFDVEPYQPPNVWFDQAAHAGLRIELELAAIDEAFRASRDLPADVILSVNSSTQTLADEHLLALLSER